MRHWLRLAFTLKGMAGSQHTRKLIPEGSRAPGFRLARLDGGESALGELIAGGPLLLAFFKVSCPVCQMTLPYLERLAVPGGLRIYAVSQNDAEDTRSFNRHFGIRLPMLLDSEEEDFPASNAFGISSVPTLFWIEADGTVGRVIEGWQKKQIEWLAEKAGVTPFRAGEKIPDWKAG